MSDEAWISAENRRWAHSTFQHMRDVWPTPRRPVIDPDRQLEIALAALEKQEQALGGRRRDSAGRFTTRPTGTPVLHSSPLEGRTAEETFTKGNAA